MVDRSIFSIEDVLVQVGSLILRVDFLVLNFNLDLEVPFILERSFMAKCFSRIDVAAEQHTILAHDKGDVFRVYKAFKLLTMYEELYVITVIDILHRRTHWRK